jgi:hypothetical protein
MGLGVAGSIAAGSAAIGAATNIAGAIGKSGAISNGQSQANALLEPYAAGGTQAFTQQSDLLGLNGQDSADKAMSTFQSSPGYAYQVQQGLRAVDAGAASKGILASGATIKAEQDRGNQLANQNFGDYYNRLNDLSRSGEAAASGQAATDTSAASNQSSIYGNAVGGVGQSLGTLATNPGVQNALTGLFSTPGEQGSWDTGQ